MLFKRRVLPYMLNQLFIYNSNMKLDCESNKRRSLHLVQKSSSFEYDLGTNLMVFR